MKEHSYYSNAPFSLYIGERGLERSQIPEILHLQVLALQRAGETVEFQVVLRRAFAAAVVREDAVLDGLLKKGRISSSILAGRSFNNPSFLRSSRTHFGFALIARFTLISSSMKIRTPAWFLSRNSFVAKSASSLAFTLPSGRMMNLSGASFMTRFLLGASKIVALMFPSREPKRAPETRERSLCSCT